MATTFLPLSGRYGAWAHPAEQKLQTRVLGRTGREVTTFGLAGGNKVMWEQPGDEATQIVVKAVRAGMTYLETANNYQLSQINYGKAFRILNLIPGPNAGPRVTTFAGQPGTPPTISGKSKTGSNKRPFISLNPVLPDRVLRYNQNMTLSRIMLVDDHEVVRIGLKSLIEGHVDFVIVAEAATEAEAVTKAAEHEPDVILMDIRLSGGNGIEACEKIMTVQPKTKIIMLTSFADDEMLFSAIRAGAVGYILKQGGGNDVIRAIEAAVQGDAMLDSSLTQRVFSEMRRSLQKEEAASFNELTDKEMQVLDQISEGKTNREIAELLFLSEGTVRNYVSSILSKLNVSNRAEAAAYAIQHHLKDHL
jgi:DNA-binding NarL/FixJ family response regulator